MLTQEKILGARIFLKWPVTAKFELKALHGVNLLIRKGVFCSKCLETVSAGFGLH